MSSCGDFSSYVVGVRFPEDSAEDIQKQKQLLKDAAAFLVSCQIPSLVSDVHMEVKCEIGGDTVSQLQCPGCPLSTKTHQYVDCIL